LLLLLPLHAIGGRKRCRIRTKIRELSGWCRPGLGSGFWLRFGHRRRWRKCHWYASHAAVLKRPRRPANVYRKEWLALEPRQGPAISAGSTLEAWRKAFLTILPSPSPPHFLHLPNVPLCLIETPSSDIAAGHDLLGNLTSNTVGCFISPAEVIQAFRNPAAASAAMRWLQKSSLRCLHSTGRIATRLSIMHLDVSYLSPVSEAVAW
jgi:hypothetical protein